MPTVSCSSCPLRSCVPEPQLADQLVEVPTVLTPTRIALQIAEQIVDTPVEEDEDDDDELLEYFCVSCEFLELQANVWQSLGHGDARLLRHSNGAVFFQFWLGEQLIIDDVVKAVGRPRLKLRPGRSGRSWVWSDPEYIGGPSEYGLCGALCVAGAGSQVPRCVGGHGVRGLASPHPILGATCADSAAVAVSSTYWVPCRGCLSLRATRT